jgi:hypothetical protein
MFDEDALYLYTYKDTREHVLPGFNVRSKNVEKKGIM